MNSTTTSADMGFLEDEGPRRGLMAWLTSTDHKRIGILYLWSMLAFFMVGVGVGVLMRLVQLDTFHHLVTPRTYNALFTVHGVIMIFLFVVPGLPAVFGNFFLPILIGAKDVAFPRLNLASWYFYIAGAILAILSLFTGGGAPDTGWTFYAPFSLQTGTNVSLAVFAAFVLGFSSMLTGINFITTIHRLRAPGMSWFRMPLFCWSLYSTSWIQILATPVLAITLILVILERFFGIGIFDPSKGGDPLLYQHLFWIYSHPAVYIMILPAMGAISEIMPTFSRKPIFGYTAIAFSSMSIAGVGSLVWAHHMFTSGMSEFANMVFSLLTMVVAIPSAIKVFNWVSTLYKGSIDVQPPLFYALTFIFLFCIGGLTGVMQGALSINVHVHDTYFIVGHFHYVMFGGTGFAFFAALLYWFPKMFGRMYSKKVIIAAWFPLFVGFNMLYFGMLVLGVQGMPRRYFEHLPMFHAGHQVVTVGSWLLALGLVIYLVALIWAARKGPRAEGNPWGGVTLEWTLPSPPIKDNFEEIPVIDHGPYEFRKGGTMVEHRDDFGSKLGMWLFLVTEILLFGGLFIAYSYMRARYPVEFHHAGAELNATLGVTNTFILLTSSLSMALGIVAMQRGQELWSRILVGCTVLLGLVFLCIKGIEWAAKFHHGLYPDSARIITLPQGERIFFGLYFSMTGLHGLHVIAGMGVLSVMLVMMLKGRINPERYTLLENGGLYWHLVDVIWIFLLPLFYLAA